MLSAGPGPEQDGAHYESNYFLTFLYLPPAEEAARAEGLLYEGRDRSGEGDAREVQRGFVERTERILGLVEGFMPEIAWLDDERTLTYLHSTVSTRRQRVRVPEIPMYLDAVLADEPLIGGLEPMLGNAHLRVLTLVGFPTVTTPGILDELNRLAFAYRWSTRAIMLDKQEATRAAGPKSEQQWLAKRKSVAAILKEVMTNEATSLLDTDANNKAMDADAALQELGSDAIGQAFFTATLTVWDDDPRFADDKTACMVEKVIQWTRLHVHGGKRQRGGGLGWGRYPATSTPMSASRGPPTLNLAHMIPLSAVLAGPARDERFRRARAVRCENRGSDVLFRFSISCGRCRSHLGGGSDRRRQVRAAGADGATVP